MFNSEDDCFGDSRTSWSRLTGLLFIVLAMLAAASAQAQPANDNFASATVITGGTGTISGSNVNATAELGEPVIAGLGGGHSIWYSWTASFTGSISFNTEGSSFDTVMAAYTGNSVNALVQVAANDDAVGGVDLTSKITFPVTSGVTYHIGVDGYFGAMGSVVLNWNATGAFSSGNFAIAVPTEPTTPTPGVPFTPATRPVYPISDYDIDSFFGAAHLRVTRYTGAAGVVHIGYVVTNTFYTNILHTNVYGTNLFITNYDSNMVMQGFTNVFLTNYYMSNDLQYVDSTGVFTTCPQTSSRGVLHTNSSTLDRTLNVPGVTAPNTNCFPSGGGSTVTNNNGTITVVVSNIFCTNFLGTNIVPSAVVGTDYEPTFGTLTFRDYEMGEWLPLDILGATTNAKNRLLVVYLTNAFLDPNEGSTLSPPSIDRIGGTAFVPLLNVNNDGTTCTNVQNTVNMGQSVYLAPFEYDEGSIPLIDLSFERANTSGPSTVPYHIGEDSNGRYDNTFALQPGSDYANPNPPDNLIPSSEPTNFTITTGNIQFGNNVTEVLMTWNPNTNTVVRFNQDLQVNLGPVPGNANWILGQVPSATITIGFHNQPAGALDRDHNLDNQRQTVPPYNLLPGANNLVYALAVQPDNKTVFAGDFTAYDTVPRDRLARMNADGSIDANFAAAPNSGADGVVTTLALQGDGNILIGGGFSAYNGTSRHGVARVTSNGGIDTSFNPGVGANGTVWSIALQPDGKVLIAGDFTLVNGTNRNGIARLNSDGSLDTTFDPGVGPDDTINKVALQVDGKILIGGDFQNVDNLGLKYLARLNSDGTLDQTFNPGGGPDASVFAITVQIDGKILIGGDFQNYNLIGRNSIARVNTDGSLDLGFVPGSGADSTVYTIALQNDGFILLGGKFNVYNGTRRIGVARVFPNGALDTSFMDTAYNQFAGIVKDYNNDNFQGRNFLLTMGLQQDGKVMIGGSFYQIGGETNGLGIFARDGIGPRENIARLIGGSTPGPGNIGLAYTNYTADKSGGPSYITLIRTNGFLGPASVTVSPTPSPVGPGAAVPGVDFDPTASNPVWSTVWDADWEFSDCFTGPNFQVTDGLNPPHELGIGFASAFVDVFNNTNTTGNLSLSVVLSQPQSLDILLLGEENIPFGVALDNNTSAPMTLVDSTLNHGVLSFSSNAFSVVESGTNATITVVRTNGTDGPVSIQYATISGGTAVPGPGNDYLTTSGSLFFNAGQSVKTFTIPIVNNSLVQPDRTVNLVLFSPTGGAIAGVTNAVLTIIDDDFKSGHVNFTSTNFTAHETGGSATITVSRTGGSQNTMSVTYVTSDGTATNGQNYGGVSNTLSWNSGDAAIKSFTVPLIHDSLVNSNLTVNLRLTNALVNGSATPLAMGLTSNAVLNIINDDFYGRPTFSTSNYTVNENAGFVTITVNRLGGSSQTISVNYTTTNGTAFAGSDYTAASGTLTFNAGEFSKAFTVQVADDFIQNGNRSFSVLLSNPQPSSGPGGGVALGTPSMATVTIVDDESFNVPPGGLDTTINPGTGFNDTVYSLALQSDGRILAAGDFTSANGTPRNRIARLNTDGSVDPKFSSPTFGLNASVRSMIIQTDNKILVGGLFTSVNGVNRNYVGRMNFDGGLDETFNPGSGADNPVYAIGETFVGPTTDSGNRRVVIGGSFVSYNGYSRNGIAQLNNDGSVDANFAPSGANGTVYALAVYSTNDSVNGGKIIIGGDFTQVNGVVRNHIARLNADGSLDTTFNPGAGPNDSVRAIAIQVDGKVVIGGLFTSVGNSPLNHIARLNPNGLVDGLFNPGVGANDIVDCIALQEDHRILIGGDFTQANGVTRNRLSRLNEDGSVDPGINFGLGADSFVSAIVVRPDDEIVVAGGFSQFEGESHPHIAWLYGRNNAGPGALQFVSADFPVIENLSTNVLITVERTGGTAGQATVLFETSDGTAASGVNYLGVTNTLVFPNGETFQSVNVPILLNNIVDIDRVVNLTLTNFTGAVQGGQPIGTITIINENSGVSFASPTYTVIKNAVNGAALISVVRSGSSIGPASVDFTTTNTGTAVPGTDYTPVSQTVFFGDGETNQFVTVPVINNGLLEGNRTVGMLLGNPTNSLLVAPSAATLTIVDNNLPPGNFAFSSVAYSVSETAGSALITVIRTNGSVGQVQVTCTVAGGTAVSNVNYIPVVTNLTFGDGITSRSFSVPVLHHAVVEGNLVVNLTLSNPTGGTQIVGQNPVPLTIIDQDTGLSFDHASYFVNDTNGTVIIGVQRVGGTNGPVSVNYSTTNGTALANTDYIATSGTLNFASGETFKTFNVQIIRNPQITGNRIFLVNLSNPGGGGQIVSPSSAAVSILDTDTGLAFASATNSAAKSAPFVVVSVVRTGSTVGPVSVGYATADGSAIGNTNYAPTNGVLSFADGQTSNSFVVQLINDNLVDPDLTFTNLLFNPSSGAQLLVPSNQTVTLVNDEAGFSFSSPAYSVSESGVSATITVVRTGYTNSLVTVNYATSDGTAHAPAKYTPASGTLTFQPGVVSQTFTVTIIDNNVIDGNQTVNLTLSSPSLSSTLLNPNSATLTIIDNDGSLILPAGAALTSESGPVNGAIDPNETVTMLFALRNAAGTNTANLVATLLATNGVSSPSGAMNYGVLVTNGPSVSRSFSFTANGTNGSLIGATFQLQDGATNLGLATFNFTLGHASNVFSSTSGITINDAAPANPYPSPINVSGVIGTVSKITATFSNLTHGNISDVSALLVGPTGTNTLLMAKIGGNNPVSGVTLTFDDLAAAGFTGNAPASGSYKPTQFSTQIPFPASTNGPGLLPKPFGTALSGFVNSNPNGMWKLFVFDDTPLDGGSIGGWSLSVNTLSIIPPAVDLVTGIAASPINSVVLSNVTYTMAVTNAGPSTATGVSLTDMLPPGVTVQLGSSQGNWTVSNGVAVCTIGTLAMGASATNTLVVTGPASPAQLTNVITASANETDADPANNTAGIVTTVASPSADLAVGISDSPDPISAGSNLTYTITVTNLGPATATTILFTNVLPAGVNFVSVSPAGIATNTFGTVIGLLPNLGSGSASTFTITAIPTVGGTVTDTVSVGSAVPDPLKGNNKASVKTVVNGGTQLMFAPSGSTFVFTWPTNGMGLQMATNLNPPVVWTSVTNPLPSIISGQNSVTMPITNGTRYFRLVSPWP